MKVDPLRHWSDWIDGTIRDLLKTPFLCWGGVERAARKFAGVFEVRREHLYFDNLPRAWDGLSITHLSDLHLGPTFTPERHLPPVLAACRDLDSDLIAMTGDWIDFSNRYLQDALPRLREVRPSLGWVGVLGNHDFFEHRWNFIRQLRNFLDDRLLINQAIELSEGGEKLAVVGLDYACQNRRLRRHAEAAQAQLPHEASFQIGLSHHPHGYDFLKPLGISLTLSGHTHGGQISLSPAPHPVIGPAMFRFRYLRGWHGTEDSRLYVHCGIGQGLPIRINCPSEVTQFILHSGKGPVLEMRQPVQQPQAAGAGQGA